METTAAALTRPQTQLSGHDQATNRQVQKMRANMIGCCGNWPEIFSGPVGAAYGYHEMASPSLISHCVKRTGQLRQGTMGDFNIVGLTNVAAGCPARSRCIDATRIPCFAASFSRIFFHLKGRALSRDRESQTSPSQDISQGFADRVSIPFPRDWTPSPIPSWRLPPWRWTATSRDATPRSRPSKQSPTFSMLLLSRIYPEGCSRFKPLERRSTQLHFEHASSTSLAPHLKGYN